MKTLKIFLTILISAILIPDKSMAQLKASSTGNDEMTASQYYEKSKSLNDLMKGVSLSFRSTATTDDKRLLKQFEKIRKLAASVLGARTEQSRSDMGQQLQLALQESNNIAKLRLTGKITLFPNDCYDQCDDQVESGAAWNEFFCVFKCFKAATVNFD